MTLILAMQHGKHGYQESTALIPNCNNQIFKTYFPHKNKKNKTLPRHKHTLGQIPTHEPVTDFINGDEIEFKNKRNKFHSLNNIK